MVHVTSNAEENDIDVAIDALADALTSLIGEPHLDDPFWQKTTERGIRGYAILIASKAKSNLSRSTEERFRSIMRSVLSIKHEQIIGFALTAFALDAPRESKPLLNEIRMLRDANPEHIKRLGFLFDRCEAKLAKPNGHK
ncbi:hypothetical protein SH467x_003121 [Pirellulaceae bacterium SH467]